MAIVGRRTQEQSMLKSPGDVSHYAGESRINSVSGAASGCRIMGFIQNQQRRWGEFAKPVSKWAGIRFVSQQGVRDDKSRVCGPRVHSVSAFSASSEYVVPIKHNEINAKPSFELTSPLQNDRWRGSNHNRAHLLSDYQLAQDQTSFDGFTQPHIIGDEEIGSGKLKCLSQRFKLIGLNLDSGSVR